MSLKLITATLVAAGTAVAMAAPQQQAPQPEVYLAPLRPGNPDPVGSWFNISNNPGYDNQPSFLPDSSDLLFSSNRDGKQMDIYRYDIAGQKVSQVTNTPEGEYSPTVTPDRKTFSAIRTEADGAQRLWRFDLDGSNPRVILENIKPVGYHAWIDETHLALFVLGSPATLQLADTKTATATVAVTGIGRSLLIRPGRGTVSYLATSETPRVMKELDLKTGTSTTLIAPVEGSQDAVWGPSRVLMMARGTTIFRWASADTAWSVFAELAAKPAGQTEITLGMAGPPPPIANITRMAVSPDGKWLAFVAEPAAAK